MNRRGRQLDPRFLPRVRPRRPWPICCALLTYFCAFTANAQEPAAPAFSAAPIQEFKIDGPRPLHMPTGLALGADGSVFIVDGVNDRIVQFDASGAVLSEISAVGDQQLSRPLSAIADASGNLWIADTGNHRILVRDPAGGLLRTLAVPVAEGDPPPDLADLALSPDGRFLWLTDNNHHRVLKLQVEGGQYSTFGRRGESLGQFHYPFRLLTTSAGEALIVDVLNGRVQRLSADGIPTGSLGSYGVESGQFYRPKALALDAEGNVWVSDGTLRVIQAFTPDGRLLGIVRDEAGEPLRLGVPIDLEFDAAGALYVLELQENRARKFTITRGPRPALPPRPERRDTATIGAQGRFCTLCHFEWMQPLQAGRATELAAVPPNPPELPYVSREENCLGCHDGSVGDARRRVWVEHGHRIGFAPPESMTLPAHLPLSDGKMVCRTCHSAHGLPESRTTLEEIVFLRVDGPPHTLCLDCHGELSTGVGAGMHPLTEMPGGVPGELLHLDYPEVRAQVTCLACHTGHGARYAQLLELDPATNQLCLTCHAEMTPALFSEATRSRHGRLPALSQPQLEVAQAWETRVGPEGELLCSTCHQSHHAQNETYLLAFDPTGQQACAACHVEQRTVTDTVHDLRTNFPEMTNLAGVSPTEGGACSGCHTAHQFARQPQPTAFDPSGNCATCHAPDTLPNVVSLGDLNHPETACTDCHDPHVARHGNFLQAPAHALCRSCHQDQSVLADSPHDVAHNPAAWPEAAIAAQDPCLACHRPHGTEQTGLFRVPPAQGAVAGSAACLACHPQAAPGASSPISFVHSPRATDIIPADVNLPLTEADGQRLLVCHTCHDPHQAGLAAREMLRTPPDAPPDQLCLTCHPQRLNVHAIGHGFMMLREAGFDARACTPCHVTHADPQSIEDAHLWPKALNPEGARSPLVHAADHYCLACHREDGPVAPPTVASHPEAQMFNISQPNELGYLPLFNEQGQLDAAGSIACQTCHLTHGRETPAPLPEGITNVSERELRARQWHLRSFGPANVCATCHGADAIRRFIYFHDLARRGGPIEG